MKELIDDFHNNGFIVLENQLNLEQCNDLIEDANLMSKDISRTYSKRGHVTVVHRMFEKSISNLSLMFKENICDLCESIINDEMTQIIGGENHKIDFTGTNSALECHVIHNNSIIVNSNSTGINTWHQDDPPHVLFLDKVNPELVHMPCLLLTVNYYLTDVLDINNGPMHVIPGSHKFGKPCISDIDESQYEVKPIFGKAGTAILFNCQLWHRGSNNSSEKDRYVSQVSYARRIIGHKYYPFMNYKMPESIVSLCNNDKRKLRLLGFLGHGPYG